MDTKYSVWQVIKFQFGLIREEKRIGAFVAYLIEPFVSGAIPVCMIVFPALVIDAIVDNNLTDVYTWSFVFAITLVVLFSIHHLLMGLFNSHTLGLRFLASKKFNDKYRYAAFSHLENPEFQAKRSTALRALRGTAVGVQGLYSDYMNILVWIVTLTGLFFIVGSFNYWILVLAIVLAIIQYRISLIAKNYSYSVRDELNERLRKAFYFFKIGHDFSYGKDIRLDQMDDALVEKHKEKSNLFLTLFKKADLFELRLSYFEVLFMVIINCIAYYFVIKGYFNNLITLGSLTMTIWAVTEITVKLQSIFRSMAKIKEESGYVSDFISFFENNSYFPNTEGTKVNLTDFEIEFKNVSFKYPNSDTYVLKNLSLVISSKEKLALVGINGAGKTTIVKLLCGFYKPTEGEIVIDGVNLDTIDLKHYREQLAVVFQDVNIYAASVIENIVGDDLSEENVKKGLEALEEVGLKDKVDSYPNKEQQQLLKVIETDGTDLSGGEAQRLSIARAVCKDHTNCIIFDEPTASLDAIHEKEIYENFKNLIKDRTSIVISHRLASTKFCDKVAFLENGAVLEYGTHDELMNIKDGKYREMFVIQGRYYQEGAISNA